MIHATVRLGFLLAAIAAGVWLYHDPGYDSLFAVLTAFSGLLATFQAAPTTAADFVRSLAIIAGETFLWCAFGSAIIGFPVMLVMGVDLSNKQASDRAYESLLPVLWPITGSLGLLLGSLRASHIPPFGSGQRADFLVGGPLLGLAASALISLAAAVGAFAPNTPRLESVFLYVTPIGGLTFWIFAAYHMRPWPPSRRTVLRLIFKALDGSAP